MAAPAEAVGSAAAAASFEHVAGKRVVVVSYGSRGDVQPFVALGTRLVQAGAEVLLLTNSDHEAFVTAFGLKVVGTAGSCRDDHRRPEFANGIVTGEFGPFWAWQMGKRRQEMPEIAKNEQKAVAEFKPDLIYATPLTYQNATQMSEQLKIPLILGTLFPTTNPFSSLGWRPFRPPTHPTLVHWTPALTQPTFWQTDTHKVVGFLVVDSQSGEAEVSDEVFGGAEARRALEEFLAAGSPPVYMGWGSMVVPHSTTPLAVRALKAAGLRGIIASGWAELGPEDLKGEEDEAELAAYASEHVLFVRSVPHEWLMPRCAATVHHGGAGTVAAALRSGVPTVITPCAIDQPDNAKIVESSGCGIAMPQYAKLTADALGTALAACVTDAEMAAKCRAMAETLHKEDGLGNAVREIDLYLASLARPEGQGERRGPPPIFKAVARFWADRAAS